MHYFVVTGNRPFPDPVRPWKQTVRVGVVAPDIHRAIELAREQSGMTETYGVSHRGSVDVVDMPAPGLNQHPLPLPEIVEQ